jgi:GNAT superfamily N-acetyltransferase
VPVILTFIKDASSSQGALSSVEATESRLLETLIFAPSPSGEPSTTSPQLGFAKTFLITAPEGEIAGIAVFFYNYSTWRAQPGICLEDLYVQPKYRRRGYARLLIQELAREARRINGGKLEWVCLKGIESALKFYDSLGAKRMEDWLSLRVDGDALVRLTEKKVCGG